MRRKTLIDLIVAITLIIAGALMLLLPILKIVKVKYVFLCILAFYGIMNALKFALTNKDKDYEGLLTSIASILTLILLNLLDVADTPVNLAITLFLWIILMSLIKLKKCDYYHDRGKKIYILKIVTLLIFILTGLLTTINLYYESSVQILMIGFFFYIHGILELVDPITNYLTGGE